MEEEQTVAPEAAPKTKRAYKSRGKMSEAEKLMRDLDAGYKHNRKMIEKSMEECGKGTNTYLAHVKALDAQLLEYARFRREIGMLPKSVAAQTTTEYVFKAHVGKGGSVQTTAVNTKQLHDIELAEAKECKKGMADSPEDEAIRAQFEAQYGDGAVQDEKEEVPEKR
jgi:hypothetical protein